MSLSVNNLSVEFDTSHGIVKAVRNVSFSVPAGKTLAIVGESGCGKSVTAYALMGVTRGRIVSGEAKLGESAFIPVRSERFRKVRGDRVSMIFQDPTASLNPTMTIGKQITEGINLPWFGGDSRQAAIKLLEQVHIPDAATRVDSFPFELSIGMQQRVMIAMALANNPEVLIADEPTTSLDVTIQAQILKLLKEIQAERGMSIIVITHDLGVVARMADFVAVMYAGQVVESGTVDDIFYRSMHPYTEGLKLSIPNNRKRKRLVAIEGTPPDLLRPPAYCSYFARCPYAMNICKQRMPELERNSKTHASRCFLKQACEVEEQCAKLG